MWWAQGRPHPSSPAPGVSAGGSPTPPQAHVPARLVLAPLQVTLHLDHLRGRCRPRLFKDWTSTSGSKGRCCLKGARQG